MTDMLEKVNELIEDNWEQTVRLTVTPSLAEAMLSFNEGNRPRSQAVIKKYAELMQAGKWPWTPQPISFSDQFVLMDGQHRLHACVRADTPIEVNVAFGVPSEVFSVIDTGKGRKAYDVFSINGVPNAKTAAGAVRWVLAYDRGAMDLENFRHLPLTPQEHYEEYEKYEDVQLSCHYGKAINSSKLGSAAMFTAAHYICARKNRTDADEFFQSLADGLFSTKDSPAYRLERLLRDNQMRRADTREPYRHLFAYTIKAWNAYRKGKVVKQFKFTQNESFPKAY